MKKKVIILRFGSATPLHKELAIIDTLTEGTQEAVGCSVHIGVISIVNTRFTPQHVAALFRGVADETNDSLPVIAWYADGDTGFDLSSEIFERFDECNRAFDEAFGEPSTQCTLSLDELLDLVSTKGLQQFTDAELKRLKELSK